MNAYELLRIEDLLTEEEETTSTRTKDAVIKVKAKKKLTEGICDINRILEKEGSVSEKLKAIADKIEEMTGIATAYAKIATEEARETYDATGKTDMKEILAGIEEKLDNAVTFQSDGMPQNAFQILNTVSNRATTGETAKEDDYLRSKTLQYIRIALANPNLDDIDSIKNLLLNLTKYMWAYSKIATTKQREEYAYGLTARVGDRALKSLGKPVIQELKNKQQYCIELPNNEECERIRVVKVAVIQSKDFMMSEDKAYGYFISKEKKDGVIENKSIMSNIDIVRMREDVGYRTKVEESLLSDEAIRLGQAYLGGYVGEVVLNKDGQLERTFDPECVGLCRELDREYRKKKTEERDNQNKQTNKESKTNKTPIDPDPDDSNR